MSRWAVVSPRSRSACSVVPAVAIRQEISVAISWCPSRSSTSVAGVELLAQFARGR
ncbi:hypothetical protein [Streptomyces sp. NPDC059142]|uniref:hypothetical protein n=1 Tax=Streptomyces sp. NPDC059142 TaxID=3346739 RepID=UPI0036941783